MEYNVYSITCKTSGKKYFGRSQEIDKRWRSHRNMLRRGIHNNTSMQSDWNLFGEVDFVFEILNTYTDKQEYIDNQSFKKYNISDAKNGGDTFSNNPRKEEIRLLKSINTSGERNPMYGKPKSEYTIQRTKEANSKPVMIEGIRYCSSTEAGMLLGLGITTVSYRLNSKSDRFKEWKYA